MRISDFRDSWLELLPFPCLQSRKSEKNENRKTEDKSKKKIKRNKQRNLILYYIMQHKRKEEKKDLNAPIVDKNKKKKIRGEKADFVIVI